MTFHHECGKGSRPREYSVTQEEFGKKFDAIDWGKKADRKAFDETCIKCPRDADVRCDYCGLLQADGSVKTLHVERFSSIGSSGTFTTGTIDIENYSVAWSVDAEGCVVGKMIKAGCSTSSDGQG